jgi:hypothetical protein
MQLRTPWLCLACLAAVGLAGCEKPGPLERAGEEIDESIETAKKGRESAATKVDDALDGTRAAIEDANDESNQE